MSLPPSGRQVHLRRGAAEAVVVEVGGALRSFEIGGVPVLFGYGESELAGAGRGQVLSPWPNRLEDGRYEFDGVTATAALDEPARNNAIHGLVRWLSFEVGHLGEDESAAVARVELPPQPGYPWRLVLEIRYELTAEDELRVATTATNLAETPAPFGLGFHPYVASGGEGVDGCRLRFSAERRLELDGRGLPVGSAPTAGTAVDFSAGRGLEAVSLDDCFTGLAGPDEADPDGAGEWRAEVTRADGRLVTLSAPLRDFAYLMVYTADTLGPTDRRKGIALEPMTCAPNALRTGEGLLRLAPGGSWLGTWRLRATGFPTTEG
jgi:aldose 1-epimerase